MRLIDADAFKIRNGMGNNCEECQNDARHCRFHYDYSKMDICDMVDDSPTVDPVKHGHWIDTEKFNEFIGMTLPITKCSKCGYEKHELHLQHTPFCEMCGAWMGVTDTNVGKMGGAE